MGLAGIVSTSRMSNVLMLCLAILVLTTNRVTAHDDNQCTASSFGYFKYNKGVHEVFSLSAEKDVQFQILAVFNGSVSDIARLKLANDSGTTTTRLKGAMAIVGIAQTATIEIDIGGALGSDFVVSGCYRFI